MGGVYPDTDTDSTVSGVVMSVQHRYQIQKMLNLPRCLALGMWESDKNITILHFHILHCCTAAAPHLRPLVRYLLSRCFVIQAQEGSG